MSVRYPLPTNHYGTMNQQRQYWNELFAATRDRFGSEPSAPARAAADLFHTERKQSIVELGAGYGRDTLFFARKGFRVCALDGADTALKAIQASAFQAGGAGQISLGLHDARDPVPLASASFDACYSHMLLCMALTTHEIERLAGEIHRVLKSGGLHMYTVRTTADLEYGIGIDLGDDMYEDDGVILHFFDRALVDRLASGFELLDVAEFEKGALPRRLYRVLMRKV